MSVEPVTITTTYDHPLFDPEEHRRVAAEKMSLGADEIHCIAAGPDSVTVTQPEKWSDAVLDPSDGHVIKASELIQPRILCYTRITAWAAKPTVERAAEPEAPKEPEIAWPTHSLPRGARWHGLVTVDGETTEEHFISTGKKLVLLYSPEGEAVLAALGGEPGGPQAATGG